MDIISFACPKCSHTLRIGADKAGKRAKCPKCKTPLVIPAPNQPATEVAAAGSGGSVLDDENAGYQLLHDPSADVPSPLALTDDDKEEEEEELSDEEIEKKRIESATKKRDRLKQIASMRKAPVSPMKWRKVRVGLLLVAIGALCWLFAFVLQKMVLLLGLLSPPEYGYLAANFLVDPTEIPRAGYAATLYRASFCVGMIGGSRFYLLNLVVFLLAYVVFIFHLLLAAVGCILCLNAPQRFGARSLAIAVMVMSGVNFLIVFFMQLLPLTGLISYTLVPLIAPEVAMSQSNIERMEPIHVTLSYSPFWESLLAILLRLMYYGDSMLFLVLLRSICKIIQEEALEKRADGLIRLLLGIAFIDMSYLLLASAGTSDVLITILRLVYGLYNGFLLLFLISFVLYIFKVRFRIDRMLRLTTFGREDEAEEAYDDYDDEDDDDDYDDEEDDE